MTMTIDISPEIETALEPEAETEDMVFAEMRALSLPTLQEYWINDADAIYDTL